MVDSSFDIGSAMMFKSHQDIEEYFAHPIHVDFIEKHIKGKVESAVAYNF